MRNKGHTRPKMKDIADMLHQGEYSCVMQKGAEIRTFTRRGVADLYDLYQSDAAFMQGASVADKVVGKGAAALMALGGIRRLYADVISAPALSLLRNAGIEISYGEEAPYIINRSHTGKCPLETACEPFSTAESIYPAIQKFVAGMRANPA